MSAGSTGFDLDAWQAGREQGVKEGRAEIAAEVVRLTEERDAAVEQVEAARRVADAANRNVTYVKGVNARLTEERERATTALRERTILLDRLALCLGLEAVEDCFIGTDSYEPYVSLVDSIAAVNKEARAVLAEIGATPATHGNGEELAKEHE